MDRNLSYADTISVLPLIVDAYGIRENNLLTSLNINTPDVIRRDTISKPSRAILNFSKFIIPKINDIMFKYAEINGVTQYKDGFDAVYAQMGVVTNIYEQPLLNVEVKLDIIRFINRMFYEDGSMTEHYKFILSKKNVKSKLILNIHLLNNNFKEMSFDSFERV